MTVTHELTVLCEGLVITEWQSYTVETSMITAADTFQLRKPFDLRSWNALRRDAHVTIMIDGVVVLDGFIDQRSVHARSGVMEIHGRDRVGRLIDESAPAISYDGMTIVDAVRKLAAPWFSRVSLSNAENRKLRKGKGRRMAAPTEPVVPISLRVPRRGKVHPGMTRWQVIHEIAQRAQLIAFSSSDGKELFIGKPNHAQPAQYLFVHAAPGSNTPTTVRDMTVVEDDGDRFSLIMVAGVGGQTDTNFGENIIDHRGVAFDNPFNKIDGTGRDFIHPKRMFMPERTFDSYADAQQVALTEQRKRDYRRHMVSVECAGFGQVLDGSSEVTLFSTDTVARCVNEELELDDEYLVVACTFAGNHDQGDVTTIHTVPTGTELIL